MKQSHAALSRRMKRYVGDIRAIKSSFNRKEGQWSASQYDYRKAISHLGPRRKTTRKKILDFLIGALRWFPPPEYPKHTLPDVWLWWVIIRTTDKVDAAVIKARPKDPISFGAGTATIKIHATHYYRSNKKILSTESDDTLTFHFAGKKYNGHEAAILRQLYHKAIRQKYFPNKESDMYDLVLKEVTFRED